MTEFISELTHAYMDQRPEKYAHNGLDPVLTLCPSQRLTAPPHHLHYHQPCPHTVPVSHLLCSIYWPVQSILL